MNWLRLIRAFASVSRPARCAVNRQQQQQTGRRIAVDHRLHFEDGHRRAGFQSARHDQRLQRRAKPVVYRNHDDRRPIFSFRISIPGNTGYPRRAADSSEWNMARDRRIGRACRSRSTPARSLPTLSCKSCRREPSPAVSSIVTANRWPMSQSKRSSTPTRKASGL